MEDILEGELHQAIEKWRETWKEGSIDDVLQLYTENVRVMRGGLGLIVGREQLKRTLQHFQGSMGLADIQFFSDEVSSISSGGNQTLAYQRYHEVLVRQDGSEISTIYGLMIWKKVSAKWLIDMYANCPVPPEDTDTSKLRMSIQQGFDQLGLAWASHNIEEAMKCYSNECLFMAPGECLRGKEAIRKWLEKAFAKDWGLLSVNVETVLPVAENYIVSQLVHVVYPSFTIQDCSGKVVMNGSGNAIVRMSDSSWEICEILWNMTST